MRPRRHSLWFELRRKAPLYLFLVPTVIFLLIFMYYPAVTAIRLSFFRWDGFSDARWIGLDNFTRMLSDSTMQASINNMLILTIARILIVLTTPLLAAELVFHLLSKRWQYRYRVIFVIPLVAPEVVIYLIWQFIFNPSIGLANTLFTNIGLGFLGQRVARQSPHRAHESGAGRFPLDCRHQLFDLPGWSARYST